MCKTYFEFLKDLAQSDWDYHDNSENIKNPFLVERDHKHFILNYFTRSGKRELVNTFFNGIFTPTRPEHVNSTFYLGLIIIKESKLNQYLNIHGFNKSGYNRLPFIWFLATLFHDFGMNHEFIDKHTGKLSTVQSIEDLYSYYGVKFKLTDIQIDSIPTELFESIPNYFKYRLTSGNIDHGIHAAIYFYDALIKNRQEKKEQTEDLEPFWDKSLDFQYGLAASSIAVHNIWVNQPKVYYENIGLSKLKNFKPISIKKYPLLFIFGLVDTIDPIKFFCSSELNLNIDQILNNLHFELNEVFVKISNSQIEPLPNFSEYIKMISKNLINWLDVDIIICNVYSIELRFH